MSATMWCPTCGAEYRPGFATCADCRVPLVDQIPTPGGESDPTPDRGRTPQPDRRFVELVRVTAAEAPMVVNRMRAGGVHSATSGAEPFYPSLAFTEGVSIVVAEDELERANAILVGLDEEG